MKRSSGRATWITLTDIHASVRQKFNINDLKTALEYGRAVNTVRSALTPCACGESQSGGGGVLRQNAFIA